MKLSTWLKDNWSKYEQKILLAAAIFLISALCFQAGISYQQTKNTNKMTILPAPDCKNVENPTEQAADVLATAYQRVNPQAPVAAAVGNLPEAETMLNESQDCSLVASKNSKKFHQAACSYAKRIKPENRVCFKNAE